MTVSGGIKFFDENVADSKDNPTIVASSGDPSAPFIADRNNYTVWRSVGSDDTTTETIEVTLASQQTFNRLFLIGHNFKDFKIERWNYGVGAWNLMGTLRGINNVTVTGPIETTFAYNTAYYEIFSLITTDRLRISVTKTQVADEQKFLNSFVVTTELGTLEGFPIVKDATKDKKIRKSTLLNGRSFVDKSIEVFRTFIDFKNYPPVLADDIDLIYSLFDRDDKFYVWLCGGRAGDSYFKYQLRGFRLQDLILVQVVNIFKDKYRKNLYNSMVDMKMKLEEAG